MEIEILKNNMSNNIETLKGIIIQKDNEIMDLIRKNDSDNKSLEN